MQTGVSDEVALVTTRVKEQLVKAGFGDTAILAVKCGCKETYLLEVVKKYGLGPVQALATMGAEHVERHVTLAVFVSHLDKYQVSAETLATCFLAQDALGTVPLHGGGKAHRVTVPNLIDLIKLFPELSDFDMLVEFAEDVMSWGVKYSIWTFIKRVVEIQSADLGGVPKTAIELLEYLSEEGEGGCGHE